MATMNKAPGRVAKGMPGRTIKAGGATGGALWPMDNESGKGAPHIVLAKEGADYQWWCGYWGLRTTESGGNVRYYNHLSPSIGVDWPYNIICLPGWDQSIVVRVNSNARDRIVVMLEQAIHIFYSGSKAADDDCPIVLRGIVVGWTYRGMKL